MTNPMVMCRNCGHFQPAELVDGSREPIRCSCPQCGGTEFRDVQGE